MKERPLSPAKPLHPYAWLWEPLEDDPSFLLRAMFGTRAAYLDGRMVLCFSATKEPWRGLLVCTERIHQESLRQQFPNLNPHPVLPKWLYLPESDERFERVAQQLVRLAQQRDPRLGIVPARRAEKSATKRSRRRGL